MPNPHVDGKNGRKAIVYNTEEEKRNGGEEKEKGKTGKIVYSQVITLEHVRGYFVYLYKRIILSF